MKSKGFIPNKHLATGSLPGEVKTWNKNIKMDEGSSPCQKKIQNPGDHEILVLKASKIPIFQGIVGCTATNVPLWEIPI